MKKDNQDLTPEQKAAVDAANQVVVHDLLILAGLADRLNHRVTGDYIRVLAHAVKKEIGTHLLTLVGNWAVEAGIIQTESTPEEKAQQEWDFLKGWNPDDGYKVN